MSKRLDGRNGDIWRAYCSGATQEALADQHGIAQSRVSQIIAAVQASLPEEDLASRRARHLEVLDALRKEALDLVRADPAPAYSNGRMMVDEAGHAVMDYGPRMMAMDRATRFLDREAKLLGLDAAQRVDVTVSEQAKQAASEAAAAAISRLHGGTGE